MLTGVLFFAFSLISDLASATISDEYNIFFPYMVNSIDAKLGNAPRGCELLYDAH